MNVTPFLKLFFTIIIWASLSNARTTIECVHFYTPPGNPGKVKKVLQIVKDWGLEAKKTKLRSVVLVEPTREQETTRWKGLLRPADSWSIVSRVLQAPVRKATEYYYGAPLEIRPFRALNEGIFQPGIRKITNYTLKKTYELSKVFLFSASVVIGAIGYHHYDIQADRIVTNKSAQVFESSKPAFQTWLISDYRFKSLAETQISKKMDANSVFALTGKFREILNEHLERITEGKAEQETYSNQEWVEAGLSNPSYGKVVYGDIIAHINEGIKVDERLFERGDFFSPHITDVQISESMRIRDRTMLSLEIAQQWIFRSPAYTKWLQHPLGSSIAKRIESEPYNMKLMQLAETGKISKERLLFLVQENIFWEGKFMGWKTLNIRPLKINLFDKVPMDKQAIEILTIKDIQNETLSEIK